MITVTDIVEWKRLRKSLGNKTLGFVPTMGNLHLGHESLLAKSIQENEITVLSIFVNPTQFNDQKDFQNYPKTLEDDLALAQSLGVNYVFLPNADMMYPDGYRYQVQEADLSQKLEGKFRPGHFTGMMTIVLKLLQLIRPTKGYFGEKDRQQLLLIQGFCEAFFLEVDIVPCPTIRNASGLALSSRNQHLSPTQLEQAARFPALLKQNSPLETIRNQLSESGFSVEYVEEEGQYRYGAIRLDSVRLIDNFSLKDIVDVQ